jgi:hypothetical protein
MSDRSESGCNVVVDLTREQPASVRPEPEHGYAALHKRLVQNARGRYEGCVQWANRTIGVSAPSGSGMSALMRLYSSMLSSIA